jgi:hypothetical protein
MTSHPNLCARAETREHDHAGRRPARAPGWLAASALLLAACGGAAPGGADAPLLQDSDVAATVPGDTTVVVTQPTVIAFYHVDRLNADVPAFVFNLENQGGTISEFEFNIPRQQSALAAMGWQLVILYRADFQAAAPDGTLLGRPENGPAGYLAAAPGRPARIHYGVLDTAELERFARGAQ